MVFFFNLLFEVIVIQGKPVLGSLVQMVVYQKACTAACQYCHSDIFKYGKCSCLNIVCRKPGFVVNAGWPEAPKPDTVLQQAGQYVETTISSIRKSIARAEMPAKPRKNGPPPTPAGKVVAMQLVVPQTYGGWQAKILNMLSSMFDASTGQLPSDVMSQVLKKANQDEELKSLGSKAMKAQVMPFAKKCVDTVAERGIEALSLKLSFDEAALLEENAAYIARALKLPGDVTVQSVSYEEQQQHENALVREASPGAPAHLFELQSPPSSRN